MGLDALVRGPLIPSLRISVDILLANGIMGGQMNLNTNQRTIGIPRPFYTYRGWRRNASNLGIKDRDWYGVQTKPNRKPYPELVIKTSERGETHYVEAPF